MAKQVVTQAAQQQTAPQTAPQTNFDSLRALFGVGQTALPQAPAEPWYNTLAGGIAPAPIVAPQHTTRRGVNKVYPRVFGKYAVVRVLHWLGYNGYSKAQAIKALGLAGVTDVNPATITTGLADGRNPNYAKPAPLTESEAAQLAAWARS